MHINRNEWTLAGKIFPVKTFMVTALNINICILTFALK